jgi:putative tryptophan/tyrosine transport system substrate-binding protein
MNRLSGQKVDFVIQNAEGSLSQAQSIAKNFHAHKKISSIFAIGTPAVQAAAKSEKQKPIFIAAVSDPESLGIIFPGTNICGTTDQINTESQADLILKLVPTVKTVSIVYNPGENNSQIMVKKMQQSLQKRGLKNITLGVHAENEIAQTIAAASRQGEVILIPNDNLLAGAMTLVAKEAQKKNCPLFVSDIALVEKGALAAQGDEYAEMGKTTAEMAHKVLFLENRPENVGIVHPTSSKIFINKAVLGALQISLPEDLISSTLIEGASHAR